MLSKLCCSLMKTSNRALPLASLPVRSFMLANKPMTQFSLVRPSLMNFSQAAETPASQMHKMTSLDHKISTFFNQTNGQELTLSGLTEFMDDILKSFMNFSDFEDYQPIVEELNFYLYEWHQNGNIHGATND